jgi:hypothetical protein
MQDRGRRIQEQPLLYRFLLFVVHAIIGFNGIGGAVRIERE